MNFALLDLVVAFFFVRCDLVHGELPLVVDGLQALLDVELFGCCLGHLVDERGVLFEMQVDNGLQCEFVAVLVKSLVGFFLLNFAPFFLVQIEQEQHFFV